MNTVCNRRKTRWKGYGNTVMKRIFSYLMPYRWRMIGGLAIKITGTFADLGLPWVLAYILDDIIPLEQVSLIVFWGIFMLILALAARIFNVMANRMASRVARDTVRRVRHDLFEKIGSLSGAQTDFFTIPSLISRMTSDSYNIHQMIGMMQRLGVRAPIILFGGIILTFSLEPVLTLVLIIIMPVLGAVVLAVSRKGIPLYGKVQQAADAMVQTLRERISGIRVIKALSKTEYEKEQFQKRNEEVVKREFKAGSIMAGSGPCMNFLLNVGLTLVIVVGAFRVNSGASEPGTITAFLSYFTMILNAVLSINRIFVIYSKASASADRIDAVLSAPEDLKQIPELCEGSLKQQGNKQELEENIRDVSEPFVEFSDVSFGYHLMPEESKELREEQLCLKHINFQIKRGSGLGIIGATGSGKSTLLHLLMRFYDVTAGTISLNGRDIRSYPLQELRSKFGVAFQNDIIFMDTIEENITIGRDIPEDQIKQAAIDANADAFIREKEGGYAYQAAIKGADFSGGQKQRLLIARALAGKPEVLILDDSSSALDYKTDASVRRAIADHYPDTTIILVAQRISSVMQMDQILVLEEGSIIGLGTHEELLQTCAVYREIYDSQIGQDLEGENYGS